LVTLSFIVSLDLFLTTLKLIRHRR
jgi:hypothetical protein